MALVLVLAFLVLISALIIAFFSSVSTELTGAKTYASGANARQLADSAVNMSMAAVRQATAGTDASSNPLAWASQPGMIRTYDTNGKPAAYYKLYSSDVPVITDFSSFDPSADAPSSWNTLSAQYTDLNAPVAGSDGTLRYPIFDPAAQTLVKGCTLDPQSSYSGANPSATNNPAPMPAKWVYILNDGTLTVPGAGSAGKVADWSGVANAPTTANPIVGRVAYWTDDDTCKVNVNTAAGDVWTDTQAAAGAAGNPGSYWDIPRYSSPFEKANLGDYQPAQHEFQRYPGHPATTYLSTVFPKLTTDNLYSITPRTKEGGSLSGTTVATGKLTPDSNRLYSSVDELLFAVGRTGSVRATNPLAGTSATDSATLDATLGPARFFLTAHSRAPEVNLFNQPRVLTWPIAAGPPAKVWPLSASTTGNPAAWRTPFDNSIAYCGTLGSNTTSNIYYFTRLDATSPTADFPTTTTGDTYNLYRNRVLMTYLRNLTSQKIPGFGGSFAAKYPDDHEQILMEIFDYIRSTNGQDISSGTPNSTPSYFGTTASPFYPYTISSSSSNAGGVSGQGQIVPISDDLTVNGTTKTLRGFGRFPTVREATMMFVGVGQTVVNNATIPPSTAKDVPPDASQKQGYDGATGVLQTDIPAGKTRVQAVFFLSLFDPSQGFAVYVPNLIVRVSGLNGFTWSQNGGAPLSMGFQPVHNVTIKQAFNTTCYGGYLGASTFIEPALTMASQSLWAKTYYPSSNGALVDYPLVSTCIDLPTAGSFVFGGGTATVDLLTPDGLTVVQTLTIPFPAIPAATSPPQSPVLPVPLLAPQFQDGGNPGNSPPIAGQVIDYRKLSPTLVETGVTTHTSANPANRFYGCGPFNGYTAWTKLFNCTRDVYRSVIANTDYRTIAALRTVPASYFSVLSNYVSSDHFSDGIAECSNGAGLYTVQNSTNPVTYPTMNALIPIALPANKGIYGQSTQYDMANAGFVDGVQPITTNGTNVNRPGGLVPPVFGTTASGTSNTIVPAYGVYAGTRMTGTANNGVSLGYPPGDWDSGISIATDGPFINKADEGSIGGINGGTPYFANLMTNAGAGPTFFSPNRMIPSPVMFGSLPTGVFSGKPWQTLLFRPDPGGTPQHLGATSPEDHLLLDLFSMPVVEPYPISDPFSTAGKVNMNYQIVPFTYITRSTGVMAVLKPEQILALPNSYAFTNTYKQSVPATPNTNYRYSLDLTDTNGTLKGFKDRFTNKDIFRSASEICDIWLVPQGQSYTGMQSYWSSNSLSGDNVRERPYADIYPRLTTKSNTYTVHYRVQTLKSVPGGGTTWREGTDQVTAEFRGSSTFERYLDTGDTTIPDYAALSTATGTTAKSLDNFYKFRVIETKQFTP